MNGLDVSDLLTIEQAAEALGNVHVRTVYRLISRGDIASIHHAGRTYIAREQIADYFKRLVTEGNKRQALRRKQQKSA